MQALYPVLGKVVLIKGEAFLELSAPTTDARYGAGKRVKLGLPHAKMNGATEFHIADGKAYPGSPRAAIVVRPPMRDASPWAWQQEALAQWRAKNRRGIIEAVTGSGKTYLAMQAIDDVLQRHRDTYTLVVVPSLLLQQQWFDRLSARFPKKRIARLGGGYSETFANGKICIAVVNSVVGVGKSADEARLLKLFHHCRTHSQNRSFLVADECHHYVHAEVFRRVRELVRYDHVLAISATVGLESGVEGLGSIVYSYTFADAIRRGNLPPLTLLNVSCRLNPDERRYYDDLSDKIRSQIEYLKRLFPEELSEENLDMDFFRKLKELEELAGPDGDAIRRLLGLLSKRSEIIYTAKEKRDAARAIIRALISSPNRRKIVVFFERIQSAAESAAQLEVRSAEKLRLEVATREIWTDVLHSGRAKDEQARIIEQFKASQRAILFACRMLDEGFDVPDVDAAVLVASTKSERQRIQRVGRVLRRGDGNKQPIVITLICEKTSDVFVVAKDRKIFGADATILSTTPGQAVDYLRSVKGRDGSA